MLRPLCLVCALTGLAHADATKIVSTETATQSIADIASAGFQCRPGLDVDHSHFPTPSSFSIAMSSSALLAHRYEMGMNDPKNRVGDHCAELERQVAALLPAKIVVKRTVKEIFSVYAGQCVRRFEETLETKLGTLELHGSSDFYVGKAPAAACNP